MANSDSQAGYNRPEGLQQQAGAVAASNAAW
jgi:hypothetical protein